MYNIGILSFPFADNYGAVLQSYALKRFLEKKGFSVSLIDYKPIYMVPIRTRIRQVVKQNKQEKKFNAFRDSYLNISRKKKFELVIVGSDQVWNPEIIECDYRWIEPPCMYNKIMAYAASIGKDYLTKNESLFFENEKSKLLTYNAISVRETAGRKLLNNIGINSKVVCDPTLLLIDDIQEYNRLADCSNINLEKDYILVYMLEISDNIKMIIDGLKNETGYCLVAIHPMNECLYNVDEFIYDAGPEDFLNILRKAKIVITNSFHGLAFSLIYKKDVISIEHRTLGSRQQQIYSLFDEGIEKLGESIVRINGNIDATELVEFVEMSKSFINDNI